MLHYCFRSSSKYRVVFRFSHSSMLTKGEKCYKMYKTKSLQYEPFAEAMSVQFTGRAECHTLCTLSIDELILLHDRNMILRQLGTCYGKDFILINSDWKKNKQIMHQYSTLQHISLDLPCYEQCRTICIYQCGGDTFHK